jgi:sugar lactone lactonase YvrE
MSECLLPVNCFLYGFFLWLASGNKLLSYLKFLGLQILRPETESASSMEVVLETPYHISSLCVNASNQLIVAAAQSGTLLLLNSDSTLAPLLESDGALAGVATAQNDVFVADTARQAVLKVEANDGQNVLTDFISQFEGKPFVGPNSISFTEDQEIVFTDGGAAGDTSLSRPQGSVYVTVQQRQQLVRLCGPSLAFPSAVATLGNAIYIAEMAANRVLRYLRRSDGHYTGSVFAQLHGTCGPSAITVDPKTGKIFVAQYEASEAGAAEGVVHVFQRSGESEGTIALPASQLTALAVDQSSNLYIAEDAGAKNKSRLFRISVA